MSLGIIIKGTEGLVLAAESRVTLMAQTQTNVGIQQIPVYWDNANKLLNFHAPYDKIGVVTYGLAVLGGARTAQSLIPEFEATLPQPEAEGATVLDFATRLSDFFKAQFDLLMPPNTVIPPGQGMIFNVAGYDDNEPYGKVYQIEIPNRLVPVEQNPKVNDKHQFGLSAGGQHEIMSRLMTGYDPRLFSILMQNGFLNQQQMAQIGPFLEQIKLQTPVQLMPLQDCVNLAVLLIKTTIEVQNLSIGIRGCGGEIDVAIITKNNPLTFIQRKNITVY